MVGFFFQILYSEIVFQIQSTGFSSPLSYISVPEIFHLWDTGEIETLLEDNSPDRFRFLGWDESAVKKTYFFQVPVKGMKCD